MNMYQVFKCMLNILYICTKYKPLDFCMGIFILSTSIIAQRRDCDFGSCTALATVKIYANKLLVKCLLLIILLLSRQMCVQYLIEIKDLLCPSWQQRNYLFFHLQGLQRSKFVVQEEHIQSRLWHFARKNLSIFVIQVLQTSHSIKKMKNFVVFSSYKVEQWLVESWIFSPVHFPFQAGEQTARKILIS